MLNLRGILCDMTIPMVMGVMNVTPDSFFAASRIQDEEAIRKRADQILEEGASIIDVGGYSTRPGAEPVSVDDEMHRLACALGIIRKYHSEAIISVDTFRSEVARCSVRDYDVDIINDISGGQLDDNMFQTVADLSVPYILTHSHGLPSLPAFTSSAVTPEDSDMLLAEVARYFATHLQTLNDLGVTDVILDPGFGFGKTLEQNYALMHRLPDLIRTFPDNAFLVGVSRKSMIYKLLGITPDESLNGTTVLHTLALQAGVQILRVHDVRAAVEVVHILQQTQSSIINHS